MMFSCKIYKTATFQFMINNLNVLLIKNKYNKFNKFNKYNKYKKKKKYGMISK